MKADIQEIIDAVEFHSTTSQSFLNIKTGKVSSYSDEEIQDAQSDEVPSNTAGWYLEAINRAKEFINNQDDYISLPDQYDFHEYRVMESFIGKVSVEKQRDLLYSAIKRKGAFRNFKDVLGQLALLDEWHQYKKVKLREFVEDWCNENNVEF